MSSVVGIFTGRGSAQAVRDLMREAGCAPQRCVLLEPDLDALRPSFTLRHRSEVMLRSAVKWGVIAALLTELPALIAVMLLPVDINVKVLMGATVWKLGGAFGAWIGAMAASDRGLDEETAEAYEARLAQGEWVLAVDMGRKAVRHIRGAMLENGAAEARDVRGTFEMKWVPPTYEILAH